MRRLKGTDTIFYLHLDPRLGEGPALDNDNAGGFAIAADLAGPNAPS